MLLGGLAATGAADALAELAGPFLSIESATTEHELKSAAHELALAFGRISAGVIVDALLLGAAKSGRIAGVPKIDQPNVTKTDVAPPTPRKAKPEADQRVDGNNPSSQSSGKKAEEGFKKSEIEAANKLREMTGITVGAHYIGKHGEIVNDKALLERATQGRNPFTGQIEYDKKGKPKYSDSTKFHTNELQLEAIEKAKRVLDATYNGNYDYRSPKNPKQKINSVVVIIDMRKDMGYGFAKRTGVMRTGLTQVTVKFDRNGNAFTAYPLYEDE